ncbi:MAG: hypothetical protein Kow0025_09550 [Thermodesulfovibrionales bacterium]
MRKGASPETRGEGPLRGAKGAGGGGAEVAAVFKALSDETRLRILKLLEGGELCVCDIVAALDTSQPRASFHLAALKEAGLIRDRREGRWTHYRLDGSDAFRRFLLLAVMERAWGGGFEADRRRLGAFLKGKAGGACGRPGASASKGGA